MTRNPAGAAPARVAPRPRGPLARAVGSYVPKLTQKAFEKYGFSAATLLTDWATIVGTELASFTAPERLKWPRGVEAYGEVADGAQGRPGATLILRVDGPRALEIEHRGRQILERINAYFGYRAVSDMRIVQAPIIRRDVRLTKPTAGTARPVAPRSGPAVDLQGISDEKLRAALATLEASIASDRRR